jgi:hypothetical protein
MYEVKSINKSDGTITFRYLNIEFDYKVSFSGKDTYSFVNPQYHYICTETDDIIVINNEVSTQRLFNIDVDNKLYKKATQYEFDRWMNNNYLDSENAHVFKLINDKINGYLNDDDSSDDEDPYYRGSIDDFVASIKK